MSYARAQLAALGAGPSAPATDLNPAAVPVGAAAVGTDPAAVPGAAAAEGTDPDGAAAGRAVAASLTREGELWEVGYGEARRHLRHTKGLHDLTVLLARPGVDVHVLELASPDAEVARAESRGAPVLDAQALSAYRSRLAQLDEEEAAAADRGDEARLARLDAEREALQAELRSAAGLGGRTRALGGDATERARKAVAARLRDATRRIGAVIPELGAHLERSLVTGTSCRYQPREPVNWSLPRN